jgi:hypothetical protein
MITRVQLKKKTEPLVMSLIGLGAKMNCKVKVKKSYPCNRP